MITPYHYLFSSMLLFVLGVMIVAVRKHPLIILMGVELILHAANLALASLASWFQNWEGQVITLVILTIAVIELAVGVALALTYPVSRPGENS